MERVSSTLLSCILRSPVQGTLHQPKNISSSLRYFASYERGHWPFPGSRVVRRRPAHRRRRAIPLVKLKSSSTPSPTSSRRIHIEQIPSMSPSQLLQAINQSSRTSSCSSSPSPEVVSIMTHRLATMKMSRGEREKTLHRLLPLIQSSIPSHDGANVAGTLNALAKMNTKVPPSVMHALNSRFESMIASMNGVHLSVALWSLSKMRVDAASTFSAAGDLLAVNNIDALGAQSLANILWAFARAKHAHDRMFMVLLKQAQTCIPKMPMQSCSMLLWAIATMGLTPSSDAAASACIVRLADHARNCPSQFTPGYASLALWSAAAADAEASDEHITRLWRQALYATEPMCLVQLHLSKCWIEQRRQQPLQMIVGSGFRRRRDGQTQLELLLKRCEVAMKEKKATAPSKLHLDVERCLYALGESPKNEFMCRKTGYRVDMALMDGKRGKYRIAIEVDGPSHFVARNGLAYNGATDLKQRILKGYGWRLLSVPFFTWDSFEKDQQKLVYLQSALARVREHKCRPR